MKTAVPKLPDGHGCVYKEVRFSPTATPARRAQSVSTSTPSMNSKYRQPRISQVPKALDLGLDTSYIEQSRELLENQRAHLESERALFAQERQLWAKERALLRTKIAELESLLKSQRSQSIISTSHPSRPSFGTPQYLDSNDHLSSAQVWEGSSPGSRPTRVFRDEEIPDNAHLSPISEGSGSNPPSLDAALSPRARAVDASGAIVSIPVPIEKLDSRLDGITLKSTALPPGVVARVITPPSPSPLETSSPAPASAPSEPARPGMEHRNSLKLKLSELGLPNENLVRDAGHTPMAIIELDVSQLTTQNASPVEILPSEEEEAPLAPMVTHANQPSEHAESYFPDVPDDPALKGPLGLTNDEEHDSSFLNELDSRLLDQAKRILSTSTISDGPDEDDDDAEAPNKGEPEPEIRFKKSTNFGTAFGISKFGKI
ncbi:uncharacterized protein N7496_004012 [Penicillium cataractarum]|uniref:Uncharacterized protein n=1 Tax=Penicillium cataractarum TaxID=2100454 RepID=A0A9W9SPQ4_9EURO|nr:uncharacterized protein N7496_004012 [Penicillium cataractarum]KAJ5381584.1 hypothetical protein N7496_004012 [Penicillium cataractarum]